MGIGEGATQEQATLHARTCSGRTQAQHGRAAGLCTAAATPAGRQPRWHPSHHRRGNGRPPHLGMAALPPLTASASNRVASVSHGQGNHQRRYDTGETLITCAQRNRPRLSLSPCRFLLTAHNLGVARGRWCARCSCLGWNFLDSHILACGASDRKLHIFDTRRQGVLCSVAGSVTSLCWNRWGRSGNATSAAAPVPAETSPKQR